MGGELHPLAALESGERVHVTPGIGHSVSSRADLDAWEKR